ncbi:hypothetical protein NE237_002256 [Protea cynaroides]|uniref:LOB domain-containing protein n=1 Tax=Protea cynaroides TaxID=273540 RepID=A0A9Q0KUW9_9MAGN|nr:hypothetical protein NE237_002256 [Protea cynaroides]
MVEKFFSMKQIDANCNKSGEIILLSGPPSCGKTSLLFQYAFNCALESSHGDRCVVFICNQRRLESKPPYLSQGIDPSSKVFQRIQMKYVDNDEGIKKYFAAFHLHKTFPLAILVDDFGDLFDERSCKERLNNPRGRDLLMVRTLALCYDAVMHANERLPSGNACNLLFSDTHHGDTPRSLFIYKRWISSIYTIKGDRPGLFLLKSSSSFGGCTKRPRSARPWFQKPLSGFRSKKETLQPTLLKRKRPVKIDIPISALNFATSTNLVSAEVLKEVEFERDGVRLLLRKEEACKSLRRRCPQDCVLAPYFPSNDPQRFASVHKIFGASNTTKILQQLPVHQRAEAADCMSFEATSRIQDPVYGCVGIISQLQHQILATQRELAMTQAQLAFHHAQQENQQQRRIMTQPQVQYDGPSWFDPNQQEPFYSDQPLLDFHHQPPGFL